MWTWFNHLESKLGSNGILRVSVDETSLPLMPKCRRGNVFEQSRVARKITLAAKRTCFTHIACVCDDSEVQPRLPQFFVMNDRVCTLRRWEELCASAPPHVSYIRQKSGWSNSELCAQYVVALRIALEPILLTRRVVLLWDAATIHNSRAVLEACRDARFWVVSIPPSVTSRLQVLDTHVFAKYKAEVWHELQKQRLRNKFESPDVVVYFECVADAMRKVFQGTSWGKAFDENGFGAAQQCISRRIVDMLGDSVVSTSLALSRNDVKLCFSRRSRVHWDLLLPFPLAAVVSFVTCLCSVNGFAFAGSRATCVAKRLGGTVAAQVKVMLTKLIMFARMLPKRSA